MSTSRSASRKRGLVSGKKARRDVNDCAAAINDCAAAFLCAITHELPFDPVIAADGHISVGCGGE